MTCSREVVAVEDARLEFSEVAAGRMSAGVRFRVLKPRTKAILAKKNRLEYIVTVEMEISF